MSLIENWYTSIVTGLGTLLLSSFAVVFSHGKQTQRIDHLDKAVHLEDGSWRFAPHKDVCKKLDGLETKIDDIRLTQTNSTKEIAKFMGRVEQVMEDIKGKS